MAYDNDNDNAETETENTDETNAQRFKRIAPKRLQNVLNAMETLRKCAGTGYEYTPEQVAKVEKYIDDEYAKLKLAFRGGKITDESPIDL